MEKNEKNVYPNIVRLNLSNELDIVVAYKRARQLSELTGLPVPSQTKFATAVSEICRNVLEHAGTGNITFSLVEEDSLCLEALVVDRGQGIPNLAEWLARREAPAPGKGNGLLNSRKLVDTFRIQTDGQQGTKVYLRKRLPLRRPLINSAIVQGWTEYFSREVNVSPYEELKRQNTQLLDVLETLRLQNIRAEVQLEEIQLLNHDLEGSGREVARLLAEREESNRQLRKMNAELEDFAYTVSHDLKAPLRNMEGLSTLLEKDLRADDEGARIKLTMLKQQIARLDGLITAILSYARSGREGLEKTTVDVGALLREVISSLTVPAGFVVQVPEKLPTLETEAIYLQQIFANLIVNAIKYHDQPAGRIVVSCRREGEFFRFAVTDDGPGILLQYQEKVFKLFYSINQPANRDSTGVGLAIIKRITEEKGGRVWVESGGRGATFAFTWPAG
ncbi:MAG: ATP-binding protein [Ferruginibacter sp.]|nr:ATP-binding protein [Cytophagales bacterium]